MIVVSDTSPLSNLLMIDRLHLLPDLFDKVFISTAVWQELLVLEEFDTDPYVLKHADWVTIQKPSQQEFVLKLREDLDPGESESIALAIELGITTILIDEKPGRTLAQKYKLNPTGVLGILLRAKALSIIPAVKPEIDKLISIAKFYISKKLYVQVLTWADEFAD